MGDTLSQLFALSLPVHSTPTVEDPPSLSRQMSDFMEQTNASLLEALPYKTSLLEISGTILKLTGTRSFYNESYGINVTTDGYCVGQYASTSTDYEVEQITAFKEYLDQKGIALLYVNLPAKYIEDSYFTDQFGGQSYLNRNMDLFLERISQAGIEYLDLRNNIVEQGLDPLSMFYRGDHHWTVPTALWASQQVAEKLNQSFGYNLNLSLYDPQRFSVQFRENCWLGEQARKLSLNYLGLDDFTLMVPEYPTSFTFYRSDGSVQATGDFGIFIDQNALQYSGDYYDGPSLHYAYGTGNCDYLVNHLIDGKNVLILGDSYQQNMLPFFSLGVSKVKAIAPRDKEVFGIKSVRDLVENGDYDIVIIAYAQFMLGAHDDPQNVNARMFDFS